MSVLQRGLRLTLHDPQLERTRDAVSPPPVLAVPAPLSAQSLLQAFTQQRSAWFPQDVDEAAQRIAQLLEAERTLSERWQGLPGTDHPQLWHAQDAAQAAVQPLGRRGRRIAVWHPPLWWALPIVRRRPRHLRLQLPLASSLKDLETLVAAAVPAAWRTLSASVRLEVETRVYWGARATGVQRGDPANVPHWRACRVRGDGLTSSEELFVLRDGHATGGTLGADDLSVTLQRHLHGGVGLLVAVPVIVYERAPHWYERLHDRLDEWWGHLWRRTGGTRNSDRDPTFEHRMAHDEAFWRVALQAPAMDKARWQRAMRDGALLRPASRPAQQHDPRRTDDTPRCHVVLVHGGLSSARSGFEGWLGPIPSSDADIALAAQRRGGVWANMPLLDEVATWRFEHDTFVSLDHNIVRLERWLAKEVIGRATQGRIVLVAHSRGGSVVRFALERLRRRFPGWTFQAMTAGAPHLGTQVFRRIGHRWAGLAGLVGAVRKVGESWLDREQLAQLVILERGLAYEVPPGFHDVEPQSVLRMARGRPQDLPEGMWLWGSAWGPATPHAVEDGLWHWLVEDIGGAEVGGDGLVARESALAGRMGTVPGTHDASPVFHTHYFAHAATREQMASVLESLTGSPPAASSSRAAYQPTSAAPESRPPDSLPSAR